MEVQSSRHKSNRLRLEDKVALVTGAAGAIGFGIADRLMNAGAVTVIADIDTDATIEFKKTHQRCPYRHCNYSCSLFTSP